MKVHSFFFFYQWKKLNNLYLDNPTMEQMSSRYAVFLDRNSIGLNEQSLTITKIFNVNLDYGNLPCIHFLSKRARIYQNQFHVYFVAQAWSMRTIWGLVWHQKWCRHLFHTAVWRQITAKLCTPSPLVKIGVKLFLGQNWMKEIATNFSFFHSVTGLTFRVALKSWERRSL